MKSRTPVITLGLLIVGMTMYSCQKGGSIANPSSSDSSTSADVAVSASLKDSASGDSTIFHPDCGRGGSLDSISVESLPAAVTAYLDTAYTGYTIKKALATKDSADVVTGYVVIIYVDDSPVGLKFDADGSFEELLEHDRHHGRGPRK
jgi:hypothetical protein